MIILPPYQRQSHGSQFYDAIFNNCLQDSSIQEITIEDPSEGFEDLRDRCDMKRLTDAGVFDDPACKAPVNKAWINMKRKEFKMALVSALLHVLALIIVLKKHSVNSSAA